MGISPTLNIPQARFLAMEHKFKAYVAGFGSGKTWVGCGGICKGMWEHPKINQGYFAPTYPQIRDIFYPTIEEVAFDWGLSVKINEGNKEVHFYEGRRFRGTTICRSMEKPGSIVGFKIGNAMVDELDVMAAAKAQQAWRKIIARMRYKVDGLRNGIDVTTTPEGFKFVYQQFVKAVREKPELSALYGLISARSIRWMNSTHSWWHISKLGALTVLSSSTSTQSLTRRVSASLVSLTYYQRRYPGRKLLPGALESPLVSTAQQCARFRRNSPISPRSWLAVSRRS